VSNGETLVRGLEAVLKGEKTKPQEAVNPFTARRWKTGKKRRKIGEKGSRGQRERRKSAQKVKREGKTKQK